ncbi:MAG: AAA family ATPase [Lachnospiraceae bacterium]|nr:AAA family ATPase [Lachnospiraceae bacterium]
MKKCLLLKGARQVGKTYTVQEFGKNEYDSLISIDFFLQPALKDIFAGELSPQEIYKRITGNIPAARLIPGNTLLFLDEIQCCGNARTALKFLAEDLRYDVIASGSLLGLAYGEDVGEGVEEPASIPVGYETQFTMYSLDFEEFLWAYGYPEETVNGLSEYMERDIQIPESMHETYENIFREYMVVGGMPEAVADFSESKDFGRVFDIQKNIIAEYQDDISKHAKGKEK